MLEARHIKALEDARTGVGLKERRSGGVSWDRNGSVQYDRIALNWRAWSLPVRAHIEHVFAEQKGRMGLFVRTIGLARATTKIGLANLVHNMRRLLWLQRQTAPT